MTRDLASFLGSSSSRTQQKALSETSMFLLSLFSFFSYLILYTSMSGSWSIIKEHVRRELWLYGLVGPLLLMLPAGVALPIDQTV